MPGAVTMSTSTGVYCEKRMDPHRFGHCAAQPGSPVTIGAPNNSHRGSPIPSREAPRHLQHTRHHQLSRGDQP